MNDKGARKLTEKQCDFCALLAGDSWYQAQVFGVHPDPTAIVSLGVILLGLRSLASEILISNAACVLRGSDPGSIGFDP